MKSWISTQYVDADVARSITKYTMYAFIIFPQQTYRDSERKKNVMNIPK